MLLLLKSKFSWANHVLDPLHVRYRETCTKLYPEHISTHPIPWATFPEEHPFSTHPSAPQIITAVVPWPHPLRHLKSQREQDSFSATALDFNLFKSILELATLKPFFSRIESQALLSRWQAAPILAPFALLLPPDSTWLTYILESLLLQDPWDAIWKEISLVFLPAWSPTPTRQPVVCGWHKIRSAGSINIHSHLMGA